MTIAIDSGKNLSFYDEFLCFLFIFLKQFYFLFSNTEVQDISEILKNNIAHFKIYIVQKAKSSGKKAQI